MVFIHRYIVETVEYKLFSTVDCHHVVAPLDETQVKQGCTYSEIIVDFIDTTQIKGETETT